MNNNREIPFFVDTEIIDDFFAFISETELNVQKENSISFGDIGTEVIEYLTVGGGIVAIVRYLVEYLKINKQKRKLTVKTKDGKMVEIESYSEEEIGRIFQNVEHVLIEELENTNKTKDENNN